MPKAYSYLRFSTPEQSAGDSHRRQSTLAENYAAKHGYTLDQSLRFEDLGRSAFRGANRTKGALRAFLDRVESGDVAQGSALLIESFDRLSREGFYDAFPVLQELFNAGISIVTLLGEPRVYSKETVREGPLALVEILFIMARGHEESAVKSRRIKELWKMKRERAKDGTPATAVCPGWLALDRRTGTFKQIPERVKIVRRIYRDTLRGVGQHALAESLNVEHVPVFGRGRHWHRSYISKVLTNPAVLGTFTPHVMTFDEASKRRRLPQDAVEGYFPAIIRADAFRRVQGLLSQARAPLRGRHAAHGELYNLFGGLMRCGRCGGSLTLVNKGQPPKGARYLVCSSAKTGAGCRYQSTRYDRVETAFLGDAARVLVQVPVAASGSETARAMANAEAGLRETDAAIENLLRAAERGKFSATLGERIETLRAVRNETAETLRTLEENAASASPRYVNALCEDLRDALTQRPLPRAKANALLRQLFASVTLDFEGGIILLEWRHGGESEVTYAWPEEKRTKRNGRSTTTPRRV